MVGHAWPGPLEEGTAPVERYEELGDFSRWRRIEARPSACLSEGRVAVLGDDEVLQQGNAEQAAALL